MTLVLLGLFAFQACKKEKKAQGIKTQAAREKNGGRKLSPTETTTLPDGHFIGQRVTAFIINDDGEKSPYEGKIIGAKKEGKAFLYDVQLDNGGTLTSFSLQSKSDNISFNS